MKKLLYIDGTVHPETSRTRRLGEALLKRAEGRYDIQRLVLEKEGLRPLDGRTLDQRDALVDREAWDDPVFRYARDFRDADRIVLAAPYWDLSFPSAVKVYLERICVCGLTFRYEEDGTPKGLCRAESWIALSAVGGFLGERDFGYYYLQGLAGMFGIPRVDRAVCEGLDIWGADVEGLMKKALEAVDALEL